MSRQGALLLGVLAIGGVMLATRREAASPAATAGATASSRQDSRRPAEPVDPDSIRDLFHFVERQSTAQPRVARPPEPHVTDPGSSPEPLRLVGLVRRQGRLLAALAIEGEVALLAPGDTRGGVTVLEVGEEGVRIRLRSGVEERLTLP